MLFPTEAISYNYEIASAKSKSPPRNDIIILIILSLFLFGCSQPSEATLVPGLPSTPAATSTPSVIRYSGDNNFIFLSIEENGYAHLFVQSENPQELPLTRITTGNWNDIAPALSPDRTQLAFASDQNWILGSVRDGLAKRRSDPGHQFTRV